MVSNHQSEAKILGEKGKDLLSVALDFNPEQ